MRIEPFHGRIPPLPPPEPPRVPYKSGDRVLVGINYEGVYAATVVIRSAPGVPRAMYYVYVDDGRIIRLDKKTPTITILDRL